MRAICDGRSSGGSARRAMGRNRCGEAADPMRARTALMGVRAGGVRPASRTGERPWMPVVNKPGWPFRVSRWSSRCRETRCPRRPGRGAASGETPVVRACRRARSRPEYWNVGLRDKLGVHVIEAEHAAACWRTCKLPVHIIEGKRRRQLSSQCEVAPVPGQHPAIGHRVTLSDLQLGGVKLPGSQARHGCCLLCRSGRRDRGGLLRGDGLGLPPWRVSGRSSAPASRWGASNPSQARQSHIAQALRRVRKRFSLEVSRRCVSKIVPGGARIGTPSGGVGGIFPAVGMEP